MEAFGKRVMPLLADVALAQAVAESPIPFS
jgi:hypothetical protein